MNENTSSYASVEYKYINGDNSVIKNLEIIDPYSTKYYLKNGIEVIVEKSKGTNFTIRKSKSKFVLKDEYNIINALSLFKILNNTSDISFLKNMFK